MRKLILQMGISIDGFAATLDGAHDWGYQRQDDDHRQWTLDNDRYAHGGATFAQALSRERLVDEYRLTIQPAALGAGLPIFKDLGGSLYLELIEERRFSTGAVCHVYRPRVTA